MYYVLLTVLLAVLIAGFGVGFALGCRLPDTGEPETRRRPAR